MTTSLVFNGINGATGEYLLPEKTPQEIARIVLGEKITKDHLSELKDQVGSELRSRRLYCQSRDRCAESGAGRLGRHFCLR